MITEIDVTPSINKPGKIYVSMWADRNYPEQEAWFTVEQAEELLANLQAAIASARLNQVDFPDPPVDPCPCQHCK